MAVVLLTFPIITFFACLWFCGVPQITYWLTHSGALTGLSFIFAWLMWTTYFLSLPVQKVAVGADGFRYWRGLRSRTIPWEEIEAVEEVSRGEMFRLTFNPGLVLGKFLAPGSLTLADYVRIRHRNGVILFPAEDKTVFLNTIRRQRAAALSPAVHSISVPTVLPVTPTTQASPVVESNSTATSDKRWYHTAYALREENKNSVHNQNR